MYMLSRLTDANGRVIALTGGQALRRQRIRCPYLALNEDMFINPRCRPDSRVSDREAYDRSIKLETYQLQPLVELEPHTSQHPIPSMSLDDFYANMSDIEEPGVKSEYLDKTPEQGSMFHSHQTFLPPYDGSSVNFDGQQPSTGNDWCSSSNIQAPGIMAPQSQSSSSLSLPPTHFGDMPALQDGNDMSINSIPSTNVNLFFDSGIQSYPSPLSNLNETAFSYPSPLVGSAGELSSAQTSLNMSMLQDDVSYFSDTPSCGSQQSVAEIDIKPIITSCPSNNTVSPRQLHRIPSESSFTLDVSPTSPAPSMLEGYNYTIPVSTGGPSMAWSTPTSTSDDGMDFSNASELIVERKPLPCSAPTSRAEVSSPVDTRMPISSLLQQERELSDPSSLDDLESQGDIESIDMGADDYDYADDQLDNNPPISSTSKAKTLTKLRLLLRDDRASLDEYLVEARKQGYRYLEIMKQVEFGVEESTLRGRYRTLTKPKEHRVRKPEWTAKDIKLLKRGVAYYQRRRGRIPWKLVSEYIVRKDGSYRFGYSTCHRKWDEVRNDGLIN